MAFGNTIKRLREDAHISVQKLSDLIGVNADRMRKWEQNDSIPRINDVSKIESFFGMDLSEIEKLESINNFLTFPNKAREVPSNYISNNNNNNLKKGQEDTSQTISLKLIREIMANTSKLISQNDVAVNSIARLVETNALQVRLLEQKLNSNASPTINN